jgi:Protein of unknown function, DUF547
MSLGPVARGAALLLALLVTACTSLVSVPQERNLALDGGLEQASSGIPSAAELANAERGFARVLEKHVDALGRVGFKAIALDQGSSGLPALQRYVSVIARLPLDHLATEPLRLAHLINAYNALSMYNVIDSGFPDTHAGWAKVRFFVLRQFTIGGRRLSLYEFENEVIRKLGEPRVHFALNCSAISCPRLPREPFRAEVLDRQLQHEARAFFARPENLSVDQAMQQVELSEILKFYTEDFVPSPAASLIAYVQTFTDHALPKHFQVRFRPYDWTVAHRP